MPRTLLLGLGFHDVTVNSTDTAAACERLAPPNEVKSPPTYVVPLKLAIARTYEFALPAYKTVPVASATIAKFFAACDTWSGVITWLKLPPIASSPTAAPCTLVIARMSPSVVSKASGVLLIGVVVATTLGVARLGVARFDRMPPRI